jgi:hypothetical protein
MDRIYRGLNFRGEIISRAILRALPTAIGQLTNYYYF